MRKKSLARRDYFWLMIILFGLPINPLTRDWFQLQGFNPVASAILAGLVGGIVGGVVGVLILWAYNVFHKPKN